MPLVRLITRDRIDWRKELDQALANNETKIELADRLKCAFRTVERKLKEHGVELPSVAERQAIQVRGKLEEAKTKGLTVAQFASQEQVSYGTARRWIKDIGVELKRGGTLPLGEERTKGIRVQASDKEWHKVFKDAVKKKKSKLELATALNVSTSTIARQMKRLGYQLVDGRKANGRQKQP